MLVQPTRALLPVQHLAVHIPEYESINPSRDIISARPHVVLRKDPIPEIAHFSALGFVEAEDEAFQNGSEEFGEESCFFAIGAEFSSRRRMSS